MEKTKDAHMRKYSWDLTKQDFFLEEQHIINSAMQRLKNDGIKYQLVSVGTTLS